VSQACFSANCTAAEQTTALSLQQAECADTSISTSIGFTAQLSTTGAAPSPTASASGSRSHVKLGAIIGGVVAGVGILGALVTVILCARRRQHNRGTAKLDQELKPASLRLASPLSYPLVPNSPNLPTTTSTPDDALLQHLTPTILEIPIALANKPSTSNSSSGRERVADMQPTIILAPPPPVPEVALSSDTYSAHPVPTPWAANAQSNTSITPLTDEQADLVAGLWRANMPTADIARVMERVRAGEASGQGSRRAEMTNDVNLDIAPPSYDVINS